MTAKSTAKPATKPKAEGVFYIVNPAGAIHAVSREHARWRLASPGWRQATVEEVAELKRRGNNQVHDHPIAPPWSPEPTELPELEEQAETSEL